MLHNAVHVKTKYALLNHASNIYQIRGNILKGKRYAYFDFQNVGFIIGTHFVLIPAIYTH